MLRSSKVILGMIITGLILCALGASITIIYHVDATPIIFVGGALMGISFPIGMICDLDSIQKAASNSDNKTKGDNAQC